MIAQVKSATLPVRDQDASLDFFTAKLGFQVRQDAPYGPGTRWIEVVPPGAVTSIILSKVDDDTAYAERMAGIVLASDDVAATAKELRERGASVTDPETQYWGTYILVDEPDGRQICIMQSEEPAGA